MGRHTLYVYTGIYTVRQKLYGYLLIKNLIFSPVLNKKNQLEVKSGSFSPFIFCLLISNNSINVQIELKSLSIIIFCNAEN